MVSETQEHDLAVEILTAAFADDPLVHWLFPDPADRDHRQARFYRAQLPFAQTHVIGTEAAALWLKVLAPAPAPDGDGRLQELGRALAGRHPREPHLYLSCMGVIPGRRGAGLGSELLRDGLEGAELGVYLEASSPRSRDLYLRHGFADLGEPVQVADSPLLWPMFKENR
ncbi:GNAT family N-acetyltransferase [Kribbella sp. NPDC051770]|uniref:GNAT family N-acetyltransferase n=1 Tax=Kribbella sp. NPDC051770 TaxID=3155413 RepID=UPI00341C0B3A